MAQDIASPSVSMPRELLAAIDHAAKLEGYGKQGRSLLIRIAVTVWLRKNGYPVEINFEPTDRAS